MLSVTNLQVFYDHAVEAVRDVSLEVGPGRLRPVHEELHTGDLVRRLGRIRQAEGRNGKR